MEKRLGFGWFALVFFFLVTGVSHALELRLNDTLFVPGEELQVFLEKSWEGLADVWVAVKLPDNSLYFKTPQGFFAEPLPYLVGEAAGGEETVLSLVLPAWLPYGTYTFYAAAFKHGSFFEEAAPLVSASFVLAEERELEPLHFEGQFFPDGIIGRRYSFVVRPVDGTPPYQLELISGELPPGLVLDTQTGALEGEPTQRGVWHLKIRVTDATGRTGEVEGDLRVFGILTVGPHGTYQGCEGLQMALNAAQDLDEIRLEQGVYECVGLRLASKDFEHGIKLCGGWDAAFEHQSPDPEATVLRGDAEPLEDYTTRDACEEADGWWNLYLGKCFAREPSGERIITVESGPVAFSNLTFERGYATNYGGAVSGSGNTFTNCNFFQNFTTQGGNLTAFGGAVSGNGNAFTNCNFSRNEAKSYGGAVSGDENTFINCTFSQNSAGQNGGGVSGNRNTFSNCNFSQNSARHDGSGGAVSGYGYFTNCNFSQNSAGLDGGVIQGSGNTFTNCSFSKNLAGRNGGVISGNRNTLTNCSFFQNSAGQNGGAVSGSGTVVNSLFVKNSAENSGGALFASRYETLTVINSTFYGNEAGEEGGAARLKGTILNSIFYENTASGSPNDFAPSGELTVDYSLFNYPSGAYNHGPHNIMGEPGFVDPTGGDFHLRSGSPAIDMGDSSVLTSCQRYYDWGSEGCDDTCRETCEDRWSGECKAHCCKCRIYTYPFLRDDDATPLDLDGTPRLKGQAIDLGPYEK